MIKRLMIMWSVGIWFVIVIGSIVGCRLLTVN